MTVGEIRDTMSQTELVEWMAYHRIESNKGKPEKSSDELMAEQLLLMSGKKK